MIEEYHDDDDEGDDYDDNHHEDDEDHLASDAIWVKKETKETTVFGCSKTTTKSRGGRHWAAALKSGHRT